MLHFIYLLRIRDAYRYLPDTEFAGYQMRPYTYRIAGYLWPEQLVYTFHKLEFFSPLLINKETSFIYLSQ